TDFLATPPPLRAGAELGGRVAAAGRRRYGLRFADVRGLPRGRFAGTVDPSRSHRPYRRGAGHPVSDSGDDADLPAADRTFRPGDPRGGRDRNARGTALDRSTGNRRSDGRPSPGNRMDAPVRLNGTGHDVDDESVGRTLARRRPTLRSPSLLSRSNP